MCLALQPTTLQAFLAWEVRQKLKHEFDGIRPIAMAGAQMRIGAFSEIWRSPSVAGFEVRLVNFWAAT